MRVLHVIPSFAPRYGGPIYALRDLAAEQARRGHDVTVATTDIDGDGRLDVPHDEPRDLDGATIRYYPVQRPRAWHFSRPLGKRLPDLADEADVVHAHSVFLWPTTAAARAARATDTPYVVRPTGFLDPTTLRKPYASGPGAALSRLKKRVYLYTLGRHDLGGADRIHYTTEAERDRSSHLGYLPEPVVVPLGVDLEDYENPSPETFLSDHPDLADRRLLLYLSRLDPKKGLDTLAEAAPAVLEDHPDVDLVVAGSGDPAYERAIRERIRETGLAGRVHLVGHVDGEAKRGLLAAAEAFVLPSHHENFGLAVLEAMAAGTPVVVGTGVNIHASITDAGAGLAVDVDARDLAEALDRVLEDDGFRAEGGKRARDLVRERYTWERTAEALADVYQALQEESP